MGGTTGRKLRSLVSIADHLADTRTPHTLTDVIAFVSLVVFILKLNADQGQSRMTRLMRSTLQDGTLYFFMTAFRIAMLFFTIIAEVTPFLPPVDEGRILTS